MESLKREFQLTSAEAAVVMLLAGGETPSDIAAKRGVSIATVRSQIQVIYGKLDIHRQAELVALISNK